MSRLRAADDADAIRRRMAQIMATENPGRVCPVNGARNLGICLQSAAPCPADCPVRDRWVGPDSGVTAALAAEGYRLERRP